jgi:lysophospholipase L1-like esterase
MPPIKEFPAFTSLIKATIGNLVEVLGEELKKVVVEYDHVYYFGEVITLKDWIKRLNIDVKKEEFFSDGVHPSKLTYQTWAKDIALKIFQNDAIKKGLALSNNEY